MGPATNTIVRNINPAEQKHLASLENQIPFLHIQIKLNHPSRTNNSNSYWVKLSLTSGTFKDL